MKDKTSSNVSCRDIVPAESERMAAKCWKARMRVTRKRESAKRRWFVQETEKKREVVEGKGPGSENRSAIGER